MWDYKMPIMNICAMSCQDERIVAYLSQQPEDLESINHTEYLIQKFSPPDIILLESLKKINQISRDCKKSKWSQFGDREEKSCTKKVKSELEKSIAIIKGELDRRGISH